MRPTLRPLLLQDLPFIHELYNEPSVHHQAVLTSMDVSLEKLEALLRYWLTDAKHLHFVIEDVDGTPLGLSQIFEIDRINRTCEVGALLLPRSQGKGIIALLHEHQMKVARDVLGVTTIHAQTVAYNSHSLHVLEKLGFQQQGIRKRALYRDDEFHDIVQCAKSLV
ncbi:GNAT family N-acetyltransferase [Tumebacillus sp. ITR2]|uniref:GNAT family N-acetyltransferase n=1 Tax=Tumebacillus amylolyticus TaxID=2801339 RepID=A0ABS1JFT1_9BACL|nr:GNAT family protein [Tumebacillus amylolyticus]MBL0389141.1 GNAT family N-acetyltransferase [Tumebacillus amylolyticus]